MLCSRATGEFHVCKHVLFFMEVLSIYSGTSRKRPSLMSGLGGRLREVITIGGLNQVTWGPD